MTGTWSTAIAWRTLPPNAAVDSSTGSMGSRKSILIRFQGCSIILRLNSPNCGPAVHHEGSNPIPHRTEKGNRRHRRLHFSLRREGPGLEGDQGPTV